MSRGRWVWGTDLPENLDKCFVAPWSGSVVPHVYIDTVLPLAFPLQLYPGFACVIILAASRCILWDKAVLCPGRASLATCAHTPCALCYHRHWTQVKWWLRLQGPGLPLVCLVTQQVSQRPVTRPHVAPVVEEEDSSHKKWNGWLSYLKGFKGCPCP